MAWGIYQTNNGFIGPGEKNMNDRDEGLRD